MKWKGRRKSSNVEDRRGMGAKTTMGGIGIAIIVIFTLLSGGNLGDILENVSPQISNAPYVETEEHKELADFVSVVLADTEDIWTEILAKEGIQYTEPTLVLYSGSVQSGCGMAGSQMGPFYCPADYKLYIDLTFFEELKTKFKAPGDFAVGYVVAHEVGHHVQNLVGIMDQMNNLRAQLSETEYNEYSVRLELQADYLAGVWGYHTNQMGLLEEGDLEEALNAASAIGDDTLQKRAQGYTVPDSFTHGTSQQRQRWFYKGFTTGDLSQWDTFGTNDL